MKSVILEIKKKMKKFEYETRLVGYDYNDERETFNYMGQNGWELVCYAQGTGVLSSSLSSRFIFKREIQ